MAEKSFGFNSAGTAPGDRGYTAADYMFWMDVNFGGNSGVVSGYLNQLAVTSLGAYSIAINTGGCVYNGYTYRNDSSATKTLDSVANTYKRYDRIVVRFDTATARNAVITVIKGTASTGTPAIPSLGASDIALGTIYIDNTSGTPSFTVTDDRTYRQLPNYYNVNSSGAISVTTNIPAMAVNEIRYFNYYSTTGGVGIKTPSSSGTYFVSWVQTSSVYTAINEIKEYSGNTSIGTTVSGGDTKQWTGFCVRKA